MIRRFIARRPALLALAVLSAAAPVTVAPDGALREAALQCQDGTCCPEIGSTCVVGSDQRVDKYYKASGPCINAS